MSIKCNLPDHLLIPVHLHEIRYHYRFILFAKPDRLKKIKDFLLSLFWCLNKINNIKMCFLYIIHINKSEDVLLNYMSDILLPLFFLGDRRNSISLFSLPETYSTNYIRSYVQSGFLRLLIVLKF